MVRLLINIEPVSDFVSTMTGGQLFGQIAWAVREAWGEARLASLLEGYREGSPFLVVSDAMPSGCIPLPAMPARWWAPQVDAKSRKRIKSLKWLPAEALSQTIESWQTLAVSEAGLATSNGWRSAAGERMHNTISRSTNTTGEGAFAPFSCESTSYAPGSSWDLHVVMDDSRMREDELRMVLESIGSFGFGADASVGMGKFVLKSLQRAGSCGETVLASHYISLAAMVPQAGIFDPLRTFYRPKVYFGRHGNVLARGETPFKKPILMADAGAFLTLQDGSDQELAYAGRGISGHSAHAQTVHQGYAPLLPVVGLGCFECSDPRGD